MKKRIFSLLLSLCMILTMFPLTVSVSAAAHSHCVCGGRTNVGDHTTHAPATDYAEFTGTGGTLSTGSYYLTADVTLSDGITIASGQTVNLCLNGFKLDGNNGAFKVITNEGTLNLCDCSPGKTGKITGGNTAIQNGGGVDNYVIAIFTMYGGSITGNTSSGGGGGVYNYMNVIFTMYGGSITGNTSSRSGGGVWNGGGTFTMSGGSITGNTASSMGGGGGGGVYNKSGGTFTMSGGSITDNTADNGGGGGGGGVYNGGNAIFTMSGGSISNNTTRDSGGGVENSGTFNLSGDVTISGNTKSSGAVTNDNVCARDPLNIAGALTNTTPIGVNRGTIDADTFTDGTAVKNITYKDKFTADNSKYRVAVDDSGEQLALKALEAMVTITVKDGGGNSVTDATVTLKGRGDPLSPTSQSNDNYYFDNTPGGSYTVVVTDLSGKNTITDAIMVEKYSFGRTLKFLGDGKSTEVDVEADVPPVAVGGLNNLLDTNIAQTLTTEEQAVLTGNGSVDLKFVASNTVDAQDKGKIAAIAAGKTIGMYIDLSVRKTVKDNGGIDITTDKKLDTLADVITVTINLPDNLKGKEADLEVYRVHGGREEKLPWGASNAVNGEYYTAYDGYLTLNLKNFSAYAVGYGNGGGTPNVPNIPNVPNFGASGWYGGWYAPAVTNAVSYNTLGGSEIATTYVNSGEVLKLPEPPTRNGYVFSGWYFDAACTKQVPGEYRPTGAVTLYAFWQTENAPVVLPPIAPTTPTAPITPTDVPRTGDSWFGNILKSLIK